jgi:DNA-directed RNA polymerase specialized sigma24 family protein
LRFQSRLRRPRAILDPDGEAVDPDAEAVTREPGCPTDEEVLDAVDSALFALHCRGASYRQVARALGLPLVRTYRRLGRVQPHVKARVKELYGRRD